MTIRYCAEINIAKVGQHGDFFYGNTIFEPNTKEPYIIDRGYYKENSNPLYDFVGIAKRAPNDSAEDFRNNLSGAGQLGPALRALILRAKEHLVLI